MNWSAITGFRLVTADLARLTAFYQAIGFVAGAAVQIAPDEMRLLGLEGTGMRQPLTLGPSRLDLDCFEEGGAPYPDDTSAADTVFQHLALVTDDAAAAWARAQAAGATPISRDGPVTLPASSGGVTAIKLRDPDGHPVEFLQFPAGANADWTGSGVFGIDHSAVSVANTAVSRRFYAERGLSEGEATLNHGATQVALDGLDDVAVDVVPMQPIARPPHVELLGYRRPAGAANGSHAVNDIAATRIVWAAGCEALLRDPDGHLHQLTSV